MIKIYALFLIALLSISCEIAPIRENQSTSPGSITAESGNEFSGKVVGVADGDTVTVLDAGNVQHKIRMLGIDAPEKRQAFGQKAKENLSDLVFGKTVTVRVVKIDKYGREVAKISLDGEDINLRQVKDGFAWHYKDYQREQSASDRQIYAEAEDSARLARSGLWFDENPQKPQDFRKKKKDKN